MILGGRPTTTTDKLRILVDYEIPEQIGPYKTRKPQRVSIGELKDVVDGIDRTIVLVREGKKPSFPNLLWWRDINSGESLPMPDTTGWPFRPAILIRMRVVIIGPNNQAQFFYNELLEVAKQESKWFIVYQIR